MTSRKDHVAVLMGGMSTEHEVSLASGAKISESLDRSRFAVTPVTITRDGLWLFPDSRSLDIFVAPRELRRLNVDCAFIALHGSFGEDGRLQGMLDLLGIPYTSSGCIASGLAMDKVRAKAVARDAGLLVARHLTMSQEAWLAEPDAALERIQSEIGFPCVIKSPCQGSSVGMAIPKTAEELRRSAPEVYRYGDRLMAEAYVSGVEVTCAVLDVSAEQRPRALPVTEIRPRTAGFFDYEAKYTPGATEEITPARLSDALTRRVQEAAILAHEAMGCAIWSRSDFIIDETGPVWIEVNTVPGMTPTSLYPQAAAAAGIGYSELLTLFVEAALNGRGGNGRKP